MDDGLISDALHIEARTGGAERAEAHGDAKDPVHLRPDRHDFRE
jgi:hypothetical protein